MRLFCHQEMTTSSPTAMMTALLATIMLIPIPVLAEEPVPSKEEFVALLKSHETAIESIQGKVKCFGQLKDQKGLEDWPLETPLGEYECKFSPPMERMWISGFDRSLNRGGIPESSVLESDRFIRRPWELGVSNGKSVTFKPRGRSGLIESEGLQDTRASAPLALEPDGMERRFAPSQYPHFASSQKAGR